MFNETGIDYLMLTGNLVHERDLTLGHLIHDFVDLHNAIAEREPFMPPSDWVQERLNQYGVQLEYRKSKYIPKFGNIFGAVWHSFVMNEWGFKPSNCKWCNSFLLTQRKGSIYCSKPRMCRFNASNYKISKEDTFSNPKKYFSYRYYLKKGIKNCGRQISLVGINNN